MAASSRATTDAKDADDNAIPNTEKTSDGQSTFTYIAGSDGAVELLITAGKATPTRVTVQVAEEAAVVEPPEPVVEPVT